MKRTTKQAGLVIAAAAAALFATASLAENTTTTNTATKAGVHCFGINSCKGQGACNTATNSCAGQNSCKHKGWITVESAKVCADKGGTVVP